MQVDRVSSVAELAMLHAYSGNANFRGRDISLSGPTATCTAATLQSKNHLDTANGIGFREWSMAEWAEVQCWNLDCSDAELSCASMTIPSSGQLHLSRGRLSDILVAGAGPSVVLCRSSGACPRRGGHFHFMICWVCWWRGP